MGQHYLSLAWAQEITALYSGNIALIGNVVDASMLVSPSLSISVSDDVRWWLEDLLVLQRPGRIMTEILLNPDALQVKSEFGMMPGSGFVQMRSYLSHIVRPSCNRRNGGHCISPNEQTRVLDQDGKDPLFL